ncbi:MAG: hypothetical protein EOO15_03575 [Chitinophagaceae bacterium]|nr:MAG: hypothetical protein EOO15_03575 [Chitinophagaceae bacterium]
MTDTLTGLSLADLKNLFRSTCARLDAAEQDPSLDKRALYKELKKLQYEISMKEVNAMEGLEG